MTSEMQLEMIIRMLAEQAIERGRKGWTDAQCAEAIHGTSRRPVKFLFFGRRARKVWLLKYEFLQGNVAQAKEQYINALDSLCMLVRKGAIGKDDAREHYRYLIEQSVSLCPEHFRDRDPIVADNVWALYHEWFPGSKPAWGEQRR